MAGIYDFTATSLAGEDVALKRFEGQVLLIVNGQQEVFNIDDAGCLDGGNLFGKFCKN